MAEVKGLKISQCYLEEGILDNFKSKSCLENNGWRSWRASVIPCTSLSLHPEFLSFLSPFLTHPVTALIAGACSFQLSSSALSRNSDLEFLIKIVWLTRYLCWDWILTMSASVQWCSEVPFCTMNEYCYDIFFYLIEPHINSKSLFTKANVF